MVEGSRWGVETLLGWVMSVQPIQEGLDGLRCYVGAAAFAADSCAGAVEDTAARLVVAVESTLRRLYCPHCGFKCHRVHDRRDTKITDLEVSGRAVMLVWKRRRMRCSNCGCRFLEDHHAFEGALTARLARALVADARVMTL